MKTPTEIKDNFDLVVDCSGSGPAMESAVPLLKHGGRLCIFGVANPNATLTLRPFEVYNNLQNIKIVAYEFMNYSPADIHERAESCRCKYQPIYISQGTGTSSCDG